MALENIRPFQIGTTRSRKETKPSRMMASSDVRERRRWLLPFRLMRVVLMAGFLLVSGCRNELDGTFLSLVIVPDQDSASHIVGLMDQFDEAHLDSAIVHRARSVFDCEASPRDYRWERKFNEKVEAILSEADGRGIDVYLGLVSSCFPFWASENAEAISVTGVTAGILLEDFDHHPSFKGWYLPDEPSPFWAYDINVPYYGFLADAIRNAESQHGASERPILLSPYLTFHEEHPRSPAAVAAWAQDLIDAGVSIIALQDSVGAHAANLGFNQDEYTVAQYFEAISAQIGHKKLWADIELFGCCTAQAGETTPYYWLPGGGATGRGSSIQRVMNQIKHIRPHVSHITSWNFVVQAAAISPHMEAARFNAAYLAATKFRGRILQPASYQWGSGDSGPHANYPDSGNEMFDKKIGYARENDWKTILDPAWTGILKDPSLEIDLGSQHTVDWVGLQLLSQNISGVRFPTQYTLEASTDGVVWTPLGSWPFPYPAAPDGTHLNGEFLYANPSALGATCRYLRIELDNDWWTFVSEIEIVSESESETP